MTDNHTINRWIKPPRKAQIGAPGSVKITLMLDTSHITYPVTRRSGACNTRNSLKTLGVTCYVTSRVTVTSPVTFNRKYMGKGIAGVQKILYIFPEFGLLILYTLTVNSYIYIV
jgi:hypothetical protein